MLSMLLVHSAQPVHSTLWQAADATALWRGCQQPAAVLVDRPSITSTIRQGNIHQTATQDTTSNEPLVWMHQKTGHEKLSINRFMQGQELSRAHTAAKLQDKLQMTTTDHHCIQQGNNQHAYSTQRQLLPCPATSSPWYLV